MSQHAQFIRAGSTGQADAGRLFRAGSYRGPGRAHPIRIIGAGSSGTAYPGLLIRTGSSGPAHPCRLIRAGSSGPVHPGRLIRAGSLTPRMGPHARRHPRPTPPTPSGPRTAGCVGGRHPATRSGAGARRQGPQGLPLSAAETQMPSTHRDLARFVLVSVGQGAASSGRLVGASDSDNRPAGPATRKVACDSDNRPVGPPAGRCGRRPPPTRQSPRNRYSG
jgi:hypothetical protein